MQSTRAAGARLRRAVLAACLVAGLAEPPPKMPQGLPQGLGKGGPPWRKAIDKVFSEACSMNKGQPSVFCFPDKKELLEALQVEKYGLDMTGEMFLMDVHVVVKQLFDWVPGWMMVADILDPKHPWTSPYCEKIAGGFWLAPVPIVRKSFMIPVQTIAQLERDLPHVHAAMSRWLEALRVSGNSHTQKLIRDVRDTDAGDVKNRTVHARPLMRLMQQTHAKMLSHIFGTACKGYPLVKRKMIKPEGNNMTLLHHLASTGNAAGAKALLKALPKDERKAWTSKEDDWGYRAEDWARLSDFPDVVDALRSAVGKTKGEEQVAEDAAALETGSAPAEPVKLFPASNGQAPSPSQGEAAVSDETCSAGSEGACGAAAGWRIEREALPGAWYPAADRPCFADTIDASQFDLEVFLAHYLLHPRPLLVRGGAVSSQNFSRAAFLEQAGERKVEVNTFPTARDFDGSKNVKKTIAEYVKYLDDRRDGGEPKRLQYLFQRLSLEEQYLNFSAKLPPMLADKADIQHVGTNFYLGGSLMGLPPHHHLPAVNSLVHGRKLWFMYPPGQEFVVHEPVHAWLQRTGGAPEAQRCMQEAGDLLFVPRAWTHGAICLGDCIGVVHEITSDEYDLRD